MSVEAIAGADEEKVTLAVRSDEFEGASWDESRATGTFGEVPYEGERAFLTGPVGLGVSGVYSQYDPKEDRKHRR